MSGNVFGADVVGPGGHEQVKNADPDRFAARVSRLGGRVAFEASGGWEAPLREALARAGVAAIRINPRRARAFALSLGPVDVQDSQIA